MTAALALSLMKIRGQHTVADHIYNAFIASTRLAKGTFIDHAPMEKNSREISRLFLL